MPKKSKIVCPECLSSRIWKDGIRYTSKGEIQRYICRSCGFRFSESTFDRQVKLNIAGQIFEEPNSGKDFSEANVTQTNLSIQPFFDDSSLQGGEDVSSHPRSDVTNTEKRLNSFRYNTGNRQESDESKRRAYVSLAMGTKNLAEVSQEEKRAAGATEQARMEAKGKIIEMALCLKKDGHSQSTIRSYTKFLKVLIEKGADLFDGDSVKEVIAKQENWSPSSKTIASAAYVFFARLNGIQWTPPKFTVTRKLPFIPLESELDALISSAGKKLASTLQLLKETGLRIGEACRLKWTDLDLERNTITINEPEKRGLARMLKISPRLAAMLNSLPRKNEYIFGGMKTSNAVNNFCQLRRRVAQKLQNPRIMSIHLHTFRHWHATMEYHKTKDILYVMKRLGHKNINATLVYTQLIQFESDEYHSAVAESVDEARKLIEAGFEYVCSFENQMLFRKRK